MYVGKVGELVEKPMARTISSGSVTDQFRFTYQVCGGENKKRQSQTLMERLQTGVAYSLG